MTRRVSLTGISTDAPGDGAGTKYYPRTEIVRLPSGSIVSIPLLESPDLSQSRLNVPLLFALAVNFLCWGFILLAGRALAVAFR